MDVESEHVLFRGKGGQKDIYNGSLSMHRSAALNVQTVGSGGEIHYRSVSLNNDPGSSQAKSSQSPSLTQNLRKPKSILTSSNSPLKQLNLGLPLESPSSAYNWPVPTPQLAASPPPRLKFESHRVSTLEDIDSAAAAVLIQYTASGEIYGITPARLVIFITSPQTIDYDMLSDFFLSYRQFMTPNDLLRLLMARYKWALSRTDDTGRAVRLRIFVTLRHWLLNYFADDFVPAVSLRTYFTDSINSFCICGKVRTSTADRKILAEMKRCWIRVCGMYWDMPDSIALDPDLYFDKQLHPGGLVGSRIPTSQPHLIYQSSPILPQDDYPASLTSLPSLSHSDRSVIETGTPDPTDRLFWGGIIRGNAVSQFLTDKQAVVGAIMPPSPTPSKLRPSNENHSKMPFKSWRNKMFRKPDEVFPDMLEAEDPELEYLGLRIDILAASMVDNHNQDQFRAAAFLPKIDLLSSPQVSSGVRTPPLGHSSESQFSSIERHGFGLRPPFVPMLQDSPSRTIQTSRNNSTDNESLHGTVLFEDVFTPSNYSEQVSISTDLLMDNEQSHMAADEGMMDPAMRAYFPDSSSSSSNFSEQASPNDRPALRRLAGRSNLRTFSPTKFKWTSSSESACSGGFGGQVTRSSIAGPVSAPLQALRDAKQHGDGVAVNGIGQDMTKEILKLAEIPDDDSAGENAVTVALRKLEGTYVPDKPASVKSMSMASEHTASGQLSDHSSARRRAWFVDSLPASSSQEQVSSGQTSNSMSFAGSKASDQSSTMSLSVHLPFVLRYCSADLAAQFTLIERDGLSEVDWKELIELRWQTKVASVQDWLAFVSTKDVRGTEFLVARFNLVTDWVTSEIVLTRKLGERVRTVVKFIHLAAHTRALHNYSTTMQVTLALASARIQGLKRTWNSVPTAELKLFQSLEELASPMKNFSNLRNEMESVDVTKGCIPFIGVYLSDLTFNAQKPAFVDRQDRDSLDNDDVFLPADSHLSRLVNLSRYRISAKIVKRLLRLVDSSRVYLQSLQVDRELLSRCLFVSSLDEEEIEECVRLIE
ncbi:ras guanine nucleotide exchange factor domain-containing protein [Lipomyces arxii]|uniref:ras guanine nucleotide exchange factor domain-containing protein n=1 Tax=Lipomyces arxii TaxID=56418 RepID=UPI0034CE63FB